MGAQRPDALLAPDVRALAGPLFIPAVLTLLELNLTKVAYKIKEFGVVAPIKLNFFNNS